MYVKIYYITKIQPSRGTASDVGGDMVETMFRNMQIASRIVISGQNQSVNQSVSQSVSQSRTQANHFATVARQRIADHGNDGD